MILIDTGPLVALCDARDAKYRRAVQQLESLAANAFGTCDAVLAEACFHLPHRSQRQRLTGLLHEPDVEAVPADPDARLWSDTLEWIESHAEHEPDWADACLPCSAEATATRRSGPTTSSSEPSGVARTAPRYRWLSASAVSLPVFRPTSGDCTRDTRTWSRWAAGFRRRRRVCDRTDRHCRFGLGSSSPTRLLIAQVIASIGLWLDCKDVKS